MSLFCWIELYIATQAHLGASILWAGPEPDSVGGSGPDPDPVGGSGSDPDPVGGSGSDPDPEGASEQIQMIMKVSY